MKGDYRDLYETNDFEIINIVKYNTSWYYDIHYSVSTKKHSQLLFSIASSNRNQGHRIFPIGSSLEIRHYSAVSIPGENFDKIRQKLPRLLL